MLMLLVFFGNLWHKHFLQDELSSILPDLIFTTVQPIDFTLGGFIADDPRKCNVV